VKQLIYIEKMEKDSVLFKRAIERVLVAVVIVVFGMLLLIECRDNERLLANSEIMNTELKTYKDKNGRMVSEMKTYSMTLSELRKDIELKKDIKKFSSVRSVVKAKGKIVFDTIRVPFEVPVPCNFIRTGKYTTEWYDLQYKVDSVGFSIEPFRTWSEQTTVVGFKRKWFLGNQYATTTITHTNPYIQITEIKAIEVPVPIKLYERKEIWGILGIVIGVMVKN